MAIDPRTADETYEDIKSSLSGKIDNLTNFLTGSFNNVFITAFSDEVRETELEALVAQLSGWPEYAGKQDFTQDDLDQLGISGVDPEELNDRMEDSQLDELGALLGVDRDQGSKSLGEVTIQTATDDTRIREGLEVGTEPDSDGSFQSFFVDADGDGEIDDSGFTTPTSGTTEVTVDVIAEEVGSDYNVAAGQITNLPNPDVGIEGVTNTTATSGGEDVQDNESYREDIQNAVFESSGGGTAAGVRGAVLDAQGVTDVAVEEFVDQQPPYVDVIVDGGTDSDVVTVIDDSKPVGVRHNLVRPRTVNVGVLTDLVGLDIDESFVSDEISGFLNELSLDDEFRRAQLTQEIMNSDLDIDDIGALAVLVLQVSNERHTYQSGTDIYRIDESPLGEVDSDEFLYDSDIDIYELAFNNMADADVTLRATVNNDDQTLVEGTDYEVIDDDSDGLNDSIDFSIGGTNPDDRSTVRVDYTHGSWTIDSTIEDENGNTYDQSSDWIVVDDDGDGISDSIDWSVGGSSPSDGEDWFVDYNPKRVVVRGLSIDIRSKIAPGSRINITTFDP